MRHDALTDEIRRLADGVHALRLVRRLIQQRKHSMALKFPIAQSLAGEITKLVDAVEGDAKEVIEKDIPAMHAKRMLLKAKAKQKVADVGSAVAEVGAFLDQLDAALEGSNSGERRPTSGDSSGRPETAQESPPPIDPVLPKAGTIAAPSATAGQGTMPRGGAAAQGTFPAGS